jgi:hypothetical protein
LSFVITATMRAHPILFARYGPANSRQKIRFFGHAEFSAAMPRVAAKSQQTGDHARAAALTSFILYLVNF